MNIRPDLNMTRDAFSQWARHQEGRFEWVGGRIVMMVDVSRYHSRIHQNLLFLLSSMLDRDRWDVHPEGFGVTTASSVRFPDIIVEPLRMENSHSDAQPVLLAEILSPSSVKTDLFEKPAEFFLLPSLQFYLVLSQEGPFAWLWQRDGDGKWTSLPFEISGRDAIIALPGLGLRLPMQDIYRNIPG